MRTYNGRKLSSYEDFDREIAEAQAEVQPVFYNDPLGKDSINNLHLIDIGKTYNIVYKNGNVEQYFVQTPNEYYALYDEMLPEGDILSITENLREGRELANYNARFEGIVNGKRRSFQLFDIDSIFGLVILMPLVAKRESNNFLLRSFLGICAHPIIYKLECFFVLNLSCNH